MDPNETLRRIRELADDQQDEDTKQMEELATLFIALDGWLSAGGFLPTAWAAKRYE